MARRRGLAGQTAIDLEGPFFEKDPVATFRENVKALMDEMAEEGEADVRTQMAYGEMARKPVKVVFPPRVRAFVRGRTKSLSGKDWGVTAVVSVETSGQPRKQAIALKAAAAEIEAKSGIFRRTTRRLRAATRDLAKGLN